MTAETTVTAEATVTTRDPEPDAGHPPSDAAAERSWRRPPAGPAEIRRDGVLAAALLAGTAVSLLLYARSGFYDDPASWWISVAYLVAITLPLALRRRYPCSVALVVSAVFVLSQLLFVPELLFSNISLFIALYTVGAWSEDRRAALVVRSVIVTGMFVWLFVALIMTASDAGAYPGASRAGPLSPFLAIGLIQIITNLLYFGGAWYFGERARAAALARYALEARTAELARERALSASRAVARERIRIARELHDVVAHHVSVMGVQAGAARRVLATAPQRASESLEAIETSARSAVDELHRLLTTLRDEECPDVGPDASTLGLDRLESLVDEMRQSGVRVTFRIVGDERAVPGTVGMTVYRIAQEAMTNTIKHAGHGAEIDLRLRYRRDGIEIEVSDSGGTASSGARGSGLGHVGMRERVAAMSGSIEIGPRARGGYLVRAELPTGPGGASGPGEVSVSTGGSASRGASASGEASAPGEAGAGPAASPSARWEAAP